MKTYTISRSLSTLCRRPQVWGRSILFFTITSIADGSNCIEPRLKGGASFANFSTSKVHATHTMQRATTSTPRKILSTSSSHSTRPSVLPSRLIRNFISQNPLSGGNTRRATKEAAENLSPGKIQPSAMFSNICLRLFS